MNNHLRVATGVVGLLGAALPLHLVLDSDPLRMVVTMVTMVTMVTIGADRCVF